MKSLLVASCVAFISLAVMLSHCEAPPPDSDANVGSPQSTSNSEIEIIKIDGHDYIIWERHPGASENVGGICHSESCKGYHVY